MRRRPLRDTALRPVRERPDGVALGSSPTRASVTVSMIEVSHLARLEGHLELLRPWGEGEERPKSGC
jgi:hypothetical protein